MENNINTNTDNISIEDQFHWYSLRVISGKERVVEDNINYESEKSNIASIDDLLIKSGLGNLANKAGVIILTRLSVHCADNITATVNSKTFL